MQHLDRLRLRLTLWYAGTFAAILIAFGAALFFAISYRVDVKLDHSLARATAEIERAVSQTDSTRGAALGPSGAPLRELRIPDRSLYVFDANGSVEYSESTSATNAWVRAAAREAMRGGAASLQADIGHEHTLRVHATRFVTPGGNTLVAAATADTEELEDEFWDLITLFTIALAIALGAVVLGGYFVARKSTIPVEQTFERMRRFMADAAHELRTPVSFLRAQADVALQQSRSAADYESQLRQIRTETDRLAAIVNDLFLLARADAGERQIAHERFYLDDVALEAASEVRTMATQRGVQVDVTDFEEAPAMGDPALTRQLLTIVLDNAIKYTEKGGSVKIAVIEEQHRATLVVEDSGIGIPSWALPRVFDRFFRAEPARKRADGAGLGLSIARWIADVQRAELVVSSEVGRGTRVQLSFPAAG